MIDLHTHTNYSDGTWNLEKLLKEAEKSKVSILSITDHDKIDAYKELKKINYKKFYSGKIITGAEFNVIFNNSKVELLGYDFDIDKIDKFIEKTYNKEEVKPDLNKEFKLMMEGCIKNNIKVDEIKYDDSMGWPIDYIYPSIKKYKENKKFFTDKEWNDIDYFFRCCTCPHCGGKSTGDQCEVCGDSLDNREVLDKHCKNCGKKTILKENKHLYFELPKFEKELQELINSNKNTWRKNALGEAQKYIDMGLVDRAATRQLDWGVKVPINGYEDKRIYVWIEAVLGYLSVGKSVAESRGIDFDKFMSNDNSSLNTYYIHGKDNIPFHTTIYPALLSALENNYRLPDYIVSSAYVNLNKEKMSKSKGNLITVNELLEMFCRDTVRFYFSFKGPETVDMNCSIEDIIQTHNKFLVGMLGNFVNRNLSFINKKFDGNIVEGKIDELIKEATQKSLLLIGKHLEKGEIRNATSEIMEYVSLANKYYDSRQPWIQVKEDMEGFNNTTYTCVYMMANIANMIAPILPEASKQIKNMVGFKDYKWEEEVISGSYHINDLQILFDRIDETKFFEQYKQKNSASKSK